MTAHHTDFSWTESWVVRNNTERSTGGGLFWGWLPYFPLVKGHKQCQAYSAAAENMKEVKNIADKWGNISGMYACVDVLILNTTNWKLLPLQLEESKKEMKLIKPWIVRKSCTKTKMQKVRWTFLCLFDCCDPVTSRKSHALSPCLTNFLSFSQTPAVSCGSLYCYLRCHL